MKRLEMYKDTPVDKAALVLKQSPILKFGKIKNNTQTNMQEL